MAGGISSKSAAWEKRLSPTMRQTHPAGARLFVDYAGQRIEVGDAATGEVRAAQVFVSATEASSYTIAEATWTQGLGRLGRLAGSHRAPWLSTATSPPISCRQPEGGVGRVARYEPGINRTCAVQGEHYGAEVRCGWSDAAPLGAGRVGARSGLLSSLA